MTGALSYCVHLCLSERSKNLNSNAHVAITKEVLRTVAYLNEDFSPLLFAVHLLAKAKCDREKECSVLSLSLSSLGGLTPAPGLNITGVAAEKTGCMGPCTQPACGAA